MLYVYTHQLWSRAHPAHPPPDRAHQRRRETDNAAGEWGGSLCTQHGRGTCRAAQQRSDCILVSAGYCGGTDGRTAGEELCMADEHGERSAGQRGLLLCRKAGEGLAGGWTLSCMRQMQQIACGWKPGCMRQLSCGRLHAAGHQIA